MSNAITELGEIMRERNTERRLSAYQTWLSKWVTTVAVPLVYDRIQAIQMGERRLMEVVQKDAVMKLAATIVGESALSYLQMPVVEADQMKVLFRCIVLKDRT